MEGDTNSGELLDQIWVLLTHVFRVTAENTDCPILQFVHLRTFPIILILASKFLILEPVQDFTDGFRWLRQHGLERDTWGEFTCLA